MKVSRLLLCSLTVLLASLPNGSPAVTFGNAGGWSQETNGLRARLTLVEKDKLHGARWLVPYLELRNVRDLANRLEVNLDRHHLKVELVGADGEPVRGGWAMPPAGSNRLGVIDKSGNFVYPPEFEGGEEFREGLAPVVVGGRWGYVDTNGSWVIQPAFRHAEEFRRGLARVSWEDGGHGYINKRGEVVWKNAPQKVFIERE